MKNENELIAEFMGTVTVVGFGVIFPVGWANSQKRQYHTSELKFSTSWDWLMPVVEKIENMMFQVEIHTAYTNINGEFGDVKYNQDSCFEAQEETKLIVTYRAVVRFIKWYNEQSKLSDLSKVIKEK